MKKKVSIAQLACLVLLSTCAHHARANDTQSQSPQVQLTPSPAQCTCPSSNCHLKAVMCVWHVFKAMVAAPSLFLSLRHFNQAYELFCDGERTKSLYQLTNTAATGYFAYVLLKDSYEGIKRELAPDTAKGTQVIDEDGEDIV